MTDTPLSKEEIARITASTMGEVTRVFKKHKDEIRKLGWDSSLGKHGRALYSLEDYKAVAYLKPERKSKKAPLPLLPVKEDLRYSQQPLAVAVKALRLRGFAVHTIAKKLNASIADVLQIVNTFSNNLKTPNTLIKENEDD